MTSLEPGSAPERLTTVDVRTRLDLLAELGYGFLESGQTSGQTRRALVGCGRALGLVGLAVNSFGRLLLLEATLPDGSTTTLSGAARTLDTIDCDRARALNHLAADLAAPEAATTGEAERRRLFAARDDVERMRGTGTPWWATTLGMTMLAFFISMQVGISWRAWVSAALVQVATSLAGLGVGRLRMPRLFAIAVQSSVGGAFATLLVRVDFVDPVGAAAAIAVTWLLLLPLPQVIGAVTDAIEADFLSCLSRVGGVAVAGIGIFIGGAFTFWLGEQLSMAHPRLDELPSLPWYLVLVFSGLGAVANAFANGGRLPLVVPAAVLGVVTGASSQLLLRVLDATTLWASSASAVVLGVLTVILASRTGYPQQVLALMGITGALLPGIPVFFGILQQMGGGAGAEYFGRAATICVGIGTGVAFGAYLAYLWDRSPLAAVGRAGAGADSP
ncbi:threonine/serine exporter family protein [Nocardioides sp.]|uniref:threonine/serine exporter family protein n=1 Tax=Nocardioides sp. TaxID=35761 RepID=UPI0039E2EEA7